jgi:hypothetical protein
MLVSRQFLKLLMEKYGKHAVYSDGGTGIKKVIKY